ncbi:membrane protein [Flagellimonas lutaonensis]|uniref:Membrane protein n=1 Tax=Flagellimonas lutaonensis TaxID=516051 RepID=A0A0D5YUJ5_9FLAO|nr:membrane protein [Allomuricauda lutaonensis]AKA35554.1 membrane protein [Allomuricauda lutaonensis]
MKKTTVLVVLFIFPLVAYLFFASGVNNFGRLPILTEKVNDLPQSPDSVKLDGQITILGFLGNKIEQRKGNVFNLNQKIYKRFNGFKDLQFVMVAPEGSEENVQALKKELGSFTDTQNWKFVYSTPSEIKELFESLQTNLNLDDSLFTPYVFIIDKERNLRGRNDDEDEGVKYGFNTSSVADLNNKMEDDVKIILAEYRLALKKNNADSSQ